VQQPGVDGLLGTGVAALADAGALADALAQVVELGAPDVTAGGDVDLLDLGRVQRERRSTPTPKDCLRTVKVSRTPWPWRLITTPSKTWVRRACPLDDLEVDTDAVAGGELRDAAQLCALEAVDHGAHGKEKAREDEVLTVPRAAAHGSEEPPPAAPRSRLRARRHWRISSWWPDSRTSGTFQPRILRWARVVRVLGVAAQRALKDSSRAESA
jgi:hypothetical protein